jgi:hypothetical protein
MPSVWRLAHQRALKEARHSLKLSGGEVVTALLVVGLYLLIVWFVVGAKEGQQELELRLSLTAALFLTFPFLYLQKFIAAPSKIYNEAQCQIQELSEQLSRKARLTLSYASDKTKKCANGSIWTYVRATNEGVNDVTGAQVKIEEAQFTRAKSELWEPTSIVSRVNMSWGYLPDGDPQKYSTVQLAPGSEVLDFISGPYELTKSDGQKCLGFIIRVDPKHKGVNPIFWEEGTYKFVMQVSAVDIEKPQKLTVFADWDGKNLVLRTDGQILDTGKILEA